MSLTESNEFPVEPEPAPEPKDRPENVGRVLPPARHRSRPVQAEPARELQPDDLPPDESDGGALSTDKPYYDVGYGRPPRDHQWRKGVSGNPKGRKKGSKNVSTILANRLNDRVKTKVNGKVTTETALEAIIRGHVYDALTQRDHKKVVYLLGEVERLRLFDEGATNPAAAEVTDETDAEIVRRLLDRLSGREANQ